MKMEDVQKLARYALSEGMDYFTVAVAFTIASDFCENPEVIKEYGTRACLSLLELKKDMETLE